MRKLIALVAMLAILVATAVPVMAQTQEFSIEEAESGDVEPQVEIVNEGDSSNFSGSLLQLGNSGNVQSVQGVLQFDVDESDDIEFEGSSIELSPELEFESEQGIEQAVVVW